MQRFVRLGSTVFIFEHFLSRHDFLSFRQKKENTASAISKVCDRYAGIELAEARLSINKRIQAVRIHYLTKNAAETMRKLQIECMRQFQNFSYITVSTAFLVP